MGNLSKYGVAIFISSIAILYWHCQPVVTLHEGHPWDSDVYYQMAQQVAAGKPLIGEKPFIYRLGTPFLVGKLFPDNIMLGFLALSTGFSVGILITTAIILKRYIQSFYIVMALLGLLIINPSGPVRFYRFMPVFTDASALFFILTIFALATAQKKTISTHVVILALSIIGVAFREIVLIAPLSLLIERCYWQHNADSTNHKPGIVWLMASVIGGLWVIIATHSTVTAIGNYTFLSHALYSIHRQLTNPDIFIVAACAIYGPVLLILLLSPRQSIHIIAQYPYLVCYTILIMLLVILGGTHTDRFVFWAFLPISLILGLLIENYRINSRNYLAMLFWAVLTITQLFAFRTFQTLPNLDIDPLKNTDHSTTTGIVLLTHYGAETNIAQLYSAYMGVELRRTVLYQYIGLLMVFRLIMPKFKNVAQ